MSVLRLIATLQCWMLTASHVMCHTGMGAGSRLLTPKAACGIRPQGRQGVGFMCSYSGTWEPDTMSQRMTALYAVPKKKPSKRRTRIRKTAWMKRYPINWKRVCFPRAPAYHPFVAHDARYVRHCQIHRRYSYEGKNYTSRLA